MSATKTPKFIFPVILLGFCAALIAIGFFVGRRVQLRQRSESVSLALTEEVEEAVRRQFATETVAGIFEVSERSMDGLEACYYADDPDFTEITWVGPAMPTPFVNYAPSPGRYYSSYINVQQCRYDEDITFDKPEGIFRIFLIGGSVAYGAAAPSNNRTIAGYLEKLLNTESRRKRFGREFQVITFANVGWCSSHERVAVHNRLVEFDPDMIIALTGHNDIAAALKDINVMWGRLFAEEMFFVLSNSVLYEKFERALPPINPGREDVRDESINERMERNIRLTHMALEPRGIEYVVALQPILVNSKKKLTPREQKAIDLSPVAQQMKPRYESMRSMLRGLDEPGLTVLDLVPMFDDAGPAELFIDNCHFGDRGNHMIAKKILESLPPLIRRRLRR